MASSRPRARRHCAEEPRLRARHPPAALRRRRCRTRCEGHCRRRHLRRAAERQRRRRRSSAARSTGSRSRSRSASPSSASASARRCWRRQLGARVYKHPRRSRRGRLLPDPSDAGGPRHLPGPGPTTSISGTARASTCRGDAVLLAEGDAFPVQAFSYGGTAYRVAVPHGRDARHDVPLDHARPCPHGDAERQAARCPFRGPAAARSRPAGLACGVHGALACARRTPQAGQTQCGASRAARRRGVSAASLRACPR